MKCDLIRLGNLGACPDIAIIQSFHKEVEMLFPHILVELVNEDVVSALKFGSQVRILCWCIS